MEFLITITKPEQIEKHFNETAQLNHSLHQWGTHGEEGIDDLKIIKTSLFKTIRLFSYRVC